MGFVVARMEKRKVGDLNGLQNHIDRKTKNHSNRDIDVEKSYLNFDVVGHDPKINNQKTVMEFINQNKISNRAVRKDAVVLTDWIITSDQKFFEGLSLEDTHKFFESAVDFFGDRYGRENIMYATVHMDETTPHMHMGIVPMRDGRLTAKTIFNRQELISLQDDLPQFFEKNGFDLERGVKGSKAEHVHHETYKKIVRQVADVVKDEIGLPPEKIAKSMLNSKREPMELLNFAIDVKEKKKKTVEKELSEARTELSEVKEEIESLKEEKRLREETVASEKEKLKSEIDKVNAERKIIADGVKNETALFKHFSGIKSAHPYDRKAEKIKALDNLSKLELEDRNTFIDRVFAYEKAFDSEKYYVQNRKLTNEKVVLERENRKLKDEIEELKPFKHFVESDKKLVDRFKNFVQESYQAVNNFINKSRGRSI